VVGNNLWKSTSVNDESSGDLFLNTSSNAALSSLMSFPNPDSLESLLESVLGMVPPVEIFLHPSQWATQMIPYGQL
jgi:hypothetical protein